MFVSLVLSSPFPSFSFPLAFLLSSFLLFLLFSSSFLLSSFSFFLFSLFFFFFLLLIRNFSRYTKEIQKFYIIFSKNHITILKTNAVVLFKLLTFLRFLHDFLNIHRWFNITNIIPPSPYDGSLEPKRYSNLQSYLLRCGTKPNEWGAQWDLNSNRNAIVSTLFLNKSLLQLGLPCYQIFSPYSWILRYYYI